MGEAQQKHRCDKQNASILSFSPAVCRCHDVPHLSSSPLHFELLNTIWLHPKTCPPSCIIIHSANPPPPSKRWWWGAKQEVKRDLKAPATHRLTPPPYQTSPLSQAAPRLCVLAPVQVLILWRGGSCFASDPGACMLDVVIINASFPPGQAVPKAGGTGGLWRGSRPGEQLCGLEAAGAPMVPWEHRCTSLPGGTTVFIQTSCTISKYAAARQGQSMLLDTLSNVQAVVEACNVIQYDTKDFDLK